MTLRKSLLSKCRPYWDTMQGQRYKFATRNIHICLLMEQVDWFLMETQLSFLVVEPERHMQQ